MKNIIEKRIENIKNILNTIPKCDFGDLYKIDDVFNLVSEDRRLTEEYIYNHPGIHPVYSAQVNGAYGYIDSYSFEGEILSVVSYGDSGKTTLRNGKLTIGRNACGLLPKENYKEKVSLKFAKYALQSIFINNAKGADLKSLSQETIKATEFFLPDIEEQRKIATEYSILESILENLEAANKKIEQIV
jgi:restriction endonuclease S subunit